MRTFSNAESLAEQAASSSSPPPTFRHAKAQDLYERITENLSKDEVRVLAHEVNRILGRPIRKNEFYYNGFGGKKVGGAGPAEEEQAAVEAEPEKTSFDLKLVGYDEKAKIKVIKEVRAITGLGLKETKELVESAPKVIQKQIKKEQAEELKAKLEELGAQIELS